MVWPLAIAALTAGEGSLPESATASSASALTHHVDGGFRNLGGVPGHGSRRRRYPAVLRPPIASFRVTAIFPPEGRE
jgi:hypothetical protein